MVANEVRTIAKVFPVAAQCLGDQFHAVQDDATRCAKCETESVSVLLTQIRECDERIAVLAQQSQVAENGPRKRSWCLANLFHRCRLIARRVLLQVVRCRSTRFTNIARLRDVDLPRPIVENFHITGHEDGDRGTEQQHEEGNHCSKLLARIDLSLASRILMNGWKRRKTAPGHDSTHY